MTFFYSVPHALIRQQVDLRATARTIEIFHRGKRVAVHHRRYGGLRHGTDPDHMPSSHRRYAEWTPERFRRWAASIGPQTEGLVVAILANRPHPEQGFRTCLGILRLFRDIDRNRAEAVSACRDWWPELQEHRLAHRQPQSDQMANSTIDCGHRLDSQGQMRLCLSSLSLSFCAA
ncbi:hypothetical protein ABID26_004481 [Mesorhizobium shonense]|uniref:Transposase for insertion sequence element IS21-like C-terminal domain-containing protein n=1 Tax=Mesorhizobium shonense TaxID=1209948 RepID=A0ABV2HWS9_9HYPH